MSNLYLLTLALVCCACSYNQMQENQRAHCMSEFPPEQYEECMGSYQMSEQEYLRQRQKVLDAQ
ncbi:hypothetical protein CHH28_01000 [Bacterioplanes sanyensis]|uniref:Uncharacterized protein n=1 Tax=Bacterioplanes sanyensis TaxID=1249553 RepID=A0A222FFJ4_9GAMM|nr:hypothetical protein [Bacterioplanes sanyensis]ASP37346.1 hypothetical protein CHH28_01000 [Bacterioplanes sanyensis]